MSDKPIFVGGFRSGTTLLINLLGLHPCIVPWFETKAFVEALRWMRVLSDPDQQEFERAYCVPPEPAGFTASAVARRMQADFEATAARVSGRIANGKAGYERYPLGADCIHYTPHRAQQALQEWQDSLSATAGFDELARATGRMIKDLGEEQLQLGGGRIWINKTPEISRFAEQLRACLGGCRIIYMVRNGMDVVSSALGLGWGSSEQLARNWQGLLALTRAAMVDYSQDYLELRYEDLLADPVTELNRVLEFCRMEALAQEMTQAWRQIPGAPALAAARDKEVRRLNAQDQLVFQKIAGQMQRELGYSDTGKQTGDCQS